jgi:hypothetical protein
MAVRIRYHVGGYNPAAAKQNMAEQWSNGAGQGDPAPGYTAWDAQGNVTSQRALTAAETAQFADADAAQAVVSNAATIDANLTALIASLQADVTQDQSVITGANPIIATTGTLTSAQLSTHVRSLATAVKALANNDINNKKSLANLLHKIQGAYTDITGT